MNNSKKILSTAIWSLMGVALMLSGCSTPGETASGTGTWKLLKPGEITPESTTLQLGVTRLDCAGGITGKVLAPEIRFDTDRILIKTDVAPLPEGANNCQGNDSVPVSVNLTEPVGERELVDVACLSGEAATTSFCADDGIRWRP